MPCRSFLTLVTLVAMMAAASLSVQGQATSDSTQRPAFRVGVDLVSLNVTVTDGTRRFVTDLDADDFTILEDGVRQKLTLFHKANLPLVLALLLDTSGSMTDKLPMAQDAATGFARQIGPADAAAVVGFDTTVTILQPFTSDTAALERAIRRTAAHGSTALYNAAYIALKELNRKPADAQPDDRRRAIVLLTDGEDTSSLVSLDDVLDLATRSGTTIYTIGIRAPGVPERFAAHEPEFALRRLAQQTGGRAFFPPALKDLAGVYQEIRDELSSQYTLVYESNNPRKDGRWRQISVRLTRAETIARTKQGYYASRR